MTAAELLAWVDEYFETHLDASYWSGLTDDNRTAAVTMAESDVLAALEIDELDETVTAMLNAIAEQAVFLARNYADLTENKVVSSEGLAGLSNSFTAMSESLGLSHRAELFIKQAKKAKLSHLISFSRG